jgi:hypothetical protein
LRILDDFSGFLNFLRGRGAEKIERSLRMMEPVKCMTAERWEGLGAGKGPEEADLPDNFSPLTSPPLKRPVFIGFRFL